MDSPREHRSVERDIDDLTNAFRRIGDHVVTVHRRLQRLEKSQEEWTMRGWEEPPGADHSSGEAA